MQFGIRNSVIITGNNLAFTLLRLQFDDKKKKRER